jgi:hypothetical protein
MEQMLSDKVRDTARLIHICIMVVFAAGNSHS